MFSRARWFSPREPKSRLKIFSLPIFSEKLVDESFRTLKARVIEDFERDYLQKMLDRHEGNITHAAHAADKNRRAFWQLLRKHGLSLHRERSRSGE